MKLDSKYFDSIRIRSGRSRAVEKSDVPSCQWKGCSGRGEHRAPKGRGLEGQFYMFCAEHARQYNSTYNYFDGMNDKEVEAFRKDAITGHRPTWKSGANAWSHGTREGGTETEVNRFSEARQARASSFAKWRAGKGEAETERPGRKLKPMEAKSLDAMGLKATASREEIKTRFKELVKRHHPDSNGGDRAAEEKLREIIQAYNYLKQAGLV